MIIRLSLLQYSGGEVPDKSSNGVESCNYSHLYYAVKSDSALSKSQVILMINLCDMISRIKKIYNDVFEYE